MTGAMVLLGLGISGFALAQDKPVAEGDKTSIASPLPILREGEVAPSYTCGYCHRDIYRTWRGSAHARSLENPVFLDNYRRLEKDEGTARARVCLKCHAPLVEVNGDTDLRWQVTWEGVNCDFCHSLVAVDMSGLVPRIKLDLGVVKYGPSRDASSMAHEVAYSALHVKSMLCAPCHEFANAEGTGIMTTYSEWKKSRAAKQGVECQDCHMSLTKGNVVDPKIKRIDNAQVNLHKVPGGHTLDQLQKALGLSIKPSRAADELVLKITLTNRGAGHAVPTGMPGRRVILQVLLDSADGRSFSQRRVYEKFMGDADGEQIRRDVDYFAKGVGLKEDTRIQADEKRTETFRFPVAASAIVFATVNLNYEHAPTGDSESRTWLTFVSEKRTIPAVGTEDGRLP